MTENTKKSASNAEIGIAPNTRRPYVRPAIEEESQLETLALGCSFTAADGCGGRSGSPEFS